jgi:hypothetical protein
MLRNAALFEGCEKTFRTFAVEHWARCSPGRACAHVEDLESGETYRAPLARRLALGQIKEADFQLAHKGLGSDDTDQKRASQRLALNHIPPEKFREEYDLKSTPVQAPEQKVEAQADAVEAKRDEIHEKITELFLTVNVHLKSLPEVERTRPILKLKTALSSLNNRDRSNRDALVSYLKKLKEDAVISDEQLKAIADFTIEDKKSSQALRKKLGEMGLAGGHLKNILRMKEEEYYIEKDFYTHSEVASKILKASASLVEYEIRKKKMLEEVESMTGIPLKEGTKIQYTYPDPEKGNIRTRTITKVQPIDSPVLDGVGIDANVLGNQCAGFKIFLDNGEEYSIGLFAKWVNASVVC